jgi:uncharacterized protein
MRKMLRDNGWPKIKGRNGLPVWRLNRVLSIIQEKICKINKENRELPIVWSVMHMYTTIQLAKIVAMKRGLDPELAALIAAFHDCYSLFTGSTKDHGINARPFINEIIDEYNQEKRGQLEKIIDEERERIIEAIKVHSNKQETSIDEFAELMKDVDCLDSYLTGMSQRPNLARVKRTNNLFKELNLECEI